MTQPLEVRSAMMSGRKRVALIVGLVAVAIFVYGWASLMAGRVWPYPLILPNRVARFGNHFDREAGVCHQLSWWSNGRYHIRGIHQVGTIPSALLIGGAPAYSADTGGRATPVYDFLLVKNGGCYQLYNGEANG